MMAELSLVARATVVLAAALAATLVCRHARASVRALLLSSSLVAVITLPVTVALVPRQTISVPASYVPGIGPRLEPVVAVEETAASAAESVQPPPAEPRLRTASVVRLLWAASSAFFVLNLVPALWRLRRTRRTGTVWPAGQRTAESIAAEIGCRRTVRLFLHDTLAAPMTYGVFRPVIGFPAAACDWDAAHLRQALVHELEHVRRLDWLMLLIGRLACAMYWFHPFVWAVARRFCLEAERACDDAVLRRADNAAYAEQLVILARRLSAPGQAAMLSMAGSSQLSSRVRAVLDSTQSRGPAGALRTAGVVSIAAALAVTVAMVEGSVRWEPQSGPPSPSGPSFEVASVRPNTSGSGSMSMGWQPGGRFVAVNAPLILLIQTAYDFRGSRLIGLPGWVESERFDIAAKAAADIDPDDRMPLLQRLLADRFQLDVRKDVRDMPVYALIPARRDRLLGAGLRASAMDCSPEARAKQPAQAGAGGASGPAGSAERPACGSVTRGSNVLAGGITIAQLAGVLTRRVDRVVIDSTGLTGLFDVDLRWSTAAGASAPLGGAALDDGPSIFTAVREQLGLELEPQRAAVEVLVVDRVERPTEN